MTEEENILDLVLLEAGDFGKYQKRICVFILLASAMIFFSSMIFLFETKHTNYRCEISGCDLNVTEYNSSWWTMAIPSRNGNPSECMKYERINEQGQTCKSTDFNKNVEVPCKKFVYETSEVSILQDFNLHCDDNLWKLTLIGTIHNSGTFVGLPISGMLSDRFGRKTILIFGMVLSGLTGLVRSFSHSYVFFTILEFLEAICMSGSLAAIWILGIEFVGPNKRVFVTILINTFYAFGGILEGLIAWQVQSWRTLLQILYSLQLMMVFYYWLIPESTLWLLSKGRFEEAKLMLKHIATINEKNISQKTLKNLEEYEVSRENTEADSIIKLFRSRILIQRFFNCSICWIGCLFLYCGIIIHSVQLSNNSYMDFILTMMVEIPGSMAYKVADKIGRRPTLSAGLFIVGLSCTSSIFISSDQYWLQLVLYLLGKFGISISVSVLFTITTEMFPTPFRNTLLSTCSMCGGFGAMIAPQLPLLKSFWKDLPLLLFAATGMLTTFLALLLPETRNIQLPNTVEEAERIGKKNKENVI